MKRITLKQIIASTNAPASLVRAVIRQSGGLESFTEKAPDIARYGASGGFYGWIYYTETTAFARKNRAGILELARSFAQDIGDGDEYQLIAGFQCLRSLQLTTGDVARAVHTGKHEDVQQIYNALAWFALEEVARSFDYLTEAA